MNGTPITGRTHVYGIVADPIAQVKAPELLNPRFAEALHDGVVVPFHVPSEGLPALVNGLRGLANLGGFAVTIPHKETMAILCDNLTEAAREAGAVNVVRREADGSLLGAMFDGEGFCAGLLAAGYAIAGARLFIAGAGGAASGIAFALARHGAAAITLANRTPARAETLAHRVTAAYPHMVLATEGGPEGHGFAVNATSLGLQPGDALPIDVAALSDDTVAVEIIMQPAETAFLVAARARGLPTHPGRAMLEHQIRMIGQFMGAPI